MHFRYPIFPIFPKLPKFPRFPIFHPTKHTTFCQKGVDVALSTFCEPMYIAILQ